MAKQPEQMEIRNKIEPLASLVWLHGIAMLIYSPDTTLELWVLSMYSKMTDNQFQLQSLIAKHCLAWTPNLSSEK